MYLQKVISRKNCVKNYFFAGILKVNDENSRIRIKDPGSGSRIQDPDPGSRSRIQIQDPDPVVKRHRYADPDPTQNVMRSATLVLTCV